MCADLIGKVRQLHEQGEPEARTLTQQVEEAQETFRHVRSFTRMLTEREGERLPEWLDAVRQDDLPTIHAPRRRHRPQP